ncbi:MAG TPA: threonine synthase [Clostridiaceae bacterium]|nr:threonine synthase [Clostridiaceae bacterium]
MQYHSTRNKNDLFSPSEAVLQGLAPDGGLFVPQELPEIDFAAWIGSDYQTIAKRIFKIFFSDLSDQVIAEIVSTAYGENFDDPRIVPVHRINKQTGFLELWHGPTLAFKDLALQFLPHLMQAAKKQLDFQQDILILTATSGDTGKAAMEGFADVEHFKVIVFYPHNGVSSFQKRQMLCREYDNVRAIALQGDFDDCQRGVKQLFSDQKFAAEVATCGYALSSANSINIGRLIPQTIYYINSYLQAVAANDLSYGETISIIVPTGNFGNILAACYAKTMGLPLGRIHLAANENNVLSDFLQTGIYDSNRTLVKTSSPSMDILVASNLERYLYLKNPDSEWLKSLMQELNVSGKFQIDTELLDLTASWTDENETSTAINHVYNTYDYLIDPHTAVGYSAIAKAGLTDLTLVASTASPYKFIEKTLAALGKEIPTDDWQSIEVIAALSGQEIPQTVSKLWQLPQDQEILISADQMSKAVFDNI